MIKKLNFPKHLKLILTLILTCLITITLTGCDTSNRKSAGNLDLNAEYASTDKYSISVGELYDELRKYASDYVINSTFELLYEDELTKVKNNPSKYKEKFEEIILKAIYSTSEEKEIAELDEKTKEANIKAYIAEMYKVGYVITKEQILEKDFATVYSKYYLEVAEYVAAWDKLSKEFTVTDGNIDFGEITDESYFTEDAVYHWYENNYKNTGYVDALLVRFVSANEAANVLKAFGIKTYNGDWYQIKGVNDTTCPSKEKYDEYYDDYKVNPTGEEGIVSIEELGNGKATILKIFAAIYNYIYTFRDPIVVDSTVKVSDYENDKHLQYYNYISAIIEKDRATKEANPENTEYAEMSKYLVETYDAALKDASAEKDLETIRMSKEKLDSYSTSLANYLYTSLATEPEEDKEIFTQYSTSAKSYGNYYFLAFKLGQEEDRVLYEETEDEESSDEHDHNIEFVDQEFLHEILKEMFEAELDEEYIHEIKHERIEKVKIKIYDSVVELQFMHTSNSELADGYEKTKKSSNDHIAYLTYKDKDNDIEREKYIKVSDAYAYLEPIYGPQIAPTLLFDKYIMDTKYYDEVENDYETYEETIELMLYYFANDYYASSGYPSSIGKFTFMQLYFGTANVETAIKETLMLADAKSAYVLDYTAHGFENDSFYEKLSTYADQTYDDYYSLTTSALQVVIDKDEDGKNDELDAATEALATELLQKAYDIVLNTKAALATAVTNVVDDFNNSSRIIDTENETTSEYDWAKYRYAGLQLTTNTIGEVTNTTTTVDEKIQERVETLYPVLVDKKLGFTSAYLDNPYEAGSVLVSEDSVSLLFVTAGTLPTSAKYENEEKPELYKEVSVVINDKTQVIELTYDSDKASKDAVKVYVSEYVMFNDVYSLPETTTTALDTFLSPVLQKYLSSASQTLIVSNAIGAITFANNAEAINSTFNDAFKTGFTRTAFLEQFIEYNKQAADNYGEETYKDWWTTMYKGGNN